MRTLAARHSGKGRGNRRPRCLRSTLTASLLLLGVAMAQAETTPWATNEGGRMRLVALPPDADGTVRGALQIAPKPAWITYWREPGDAGIPPHVTFSKQAGVTLEQISSPFPKRLAQAEMREISTNHPVHLPLDLSDIH